MINNLRYKLHNEAWLEWTEFSMLVTVYIYTVRSDCEVPCFGTVHSIFCHFTHCYQIGIKNRHACCDAKNPELSPYSGPRNMDLEVGDGPKWAEKTKN